MVRQNSSENDLPNYFNKLDVVRNQMRINRECDESHAINEHTFIAIYLYSVFMRSIPIVKEIHKIRRAE